MFTVMEMEKYSQIIILSDSYNINEENILVLNEEVTLIDDMHISTKDCNYTFDYLIFTDVLKIKNFRSTNILHEDNVPVTNFFHQTTYENIYYPINGNINEALENIMEE